MDDSTRIAGDSQTPWQLFKYVDLLPSAALKVAPVALLTLGSMAFAKYAPVTFLLTTVTWTVLSAHTFTKQLAHSTDPFTVQKTLIVALTVLGSLILGGSLSSIFNSSLWLAKEALALNMSTSIISSFWITGVGGYILPAAIEVLQTARNFVEKKELLAFLKHVESQPKIRGLYENMAPFSKLLLFLSFALPNMTENIPFWNFFAPAEVVQAVTLMKPPQEIKSHLNDLEVYLEDLEIFKTFSDRNIGSANHIIDLRIKKMLEVVNSSQKFPEEHFDRLVDLLMNIHEKKILSSREIKPVFANNWIYKALDKKTKQLAFDFKHELYYGKLGSIQTRATKLKESLRQPQKNTNALEQDYNSISEEFQALKQSILGAIQQHKRWANPNLPDCLPSTILPNVNDIKFDSKEFDTLKAIVMGLNRTLPIISDLQEIHKGLNSKVSVSAWLYLAAEKCEFKTPDYEELKGWLEVNDLYDIESKMESIGLKTEQDLYDHNIVRLSSSKAQIKQNLKEYIRLKVSPDLRTRIYNNLAAVAIDTSWSKVYQVAERTFYRIFISTMVLMPIVQYPRLSVLGLGAGIIYHTAIRVSRFIAEVEFIPAIPRLNAILTLITRRNFFSLTSSSRRNMDHFVETSIFGKMRLLNYEILLTSSILSLSISPLSTSESGAGGLFQGFYLGREIVDFLSDRIAEIRRPVAV